MRLHLKASTPTVDVAVVELKNGMVFTPAIWQALGYSKYTVACIGAAGGRGGHNGGYQATNPSYSVVRMGGGGGGGGLHVVSGLLATLPESVPVVIGTRGTNGLDKPVWGQTGGNGADGGATTFGGTICMASGGKGGLGATGDAFVNVFGGDGGIGNSTVAGGGGAGGRSGEIPIAGANGLYADGIGAGGGGGGGGLGTLTGTALNGWYIPATNAGSGSVDNLNADGKTVSGGRIADMNINPQLTSGSGAHGGGANAIFLTGSHYIAGSYHHALWATPGTEHGACFIQLTN